MPQVTCMSRGNAAGFTLIEVIVALAVFSLAALALLRLQGVAITTTTRLDERLAADIVAQNQLTEALLLPARPGSGEEVAGHRRWLWQRRITATADPRLVRIDVLVSDNVGQPLGTAMGYGRAS